MRLLNEAGGELASLNVTPSESLLGKDREVSATINAHPSLRVISDHSNVYSSRKTKGLNIMEIISNLSQIDGKQLVNEKNGALTYSSDLFSNKGHTLSLGNGITDVEVSKMIDSPNEVIVVGDTIANNESVFVVLKNIERMRSDSGKGANSELVNSLRKEIPGLTTKNEALRLAKSMLHRAENGAPVVTIKNALKSTMVQPGEIVHLNLPMHDLVGEYAVFEAKHDYANARSDFVLAQYEKGIEGLLSDIQSAIGNTSPLEDNAGSVVDVFEVSLAGGINLVGAHKVYIRKVNGRGFIIGKNQN